MSLINKMLQDLDARAGQPGAEAIPSDIRLVAPSERSLPWKRVALGAGAALAVAALAFAGWRIVKQKPAPAQLASAQPAVQPPVQPKPAAPAPAPSVPAPAPAVAFEIPVPPRADVLAKAAAAEVVPAEAKAPPPAAKKAPAPAVAADEPATPAPPMKAAKSNAKGPDAQPAARVRAERTPAGSKAAPAVGAGRVDNPSQRAENAYGRALASLEDGRVTEAIAALEAALRIDPRHEPSRQTLVSLLIEARRPDDAMRQLQAALVLDPRQPSLAMLLARLQIERGGPAIDTLLRTLPYAAGDGEYHAFLAGALQREGRHREAAEHYGVALRAAPQNGVWWMGLGISLQAEKRAVEAAEAFQKARASGMLSPELQGFVERKLKQLGR